MQKLTRQDRNTESASFSDALKRLASVPKAEILKRIEQAPKEPVSRHKRYKYVPAVPAGKP